MIRISIKYCAVKCVVCHWLLYSIQSDHIYCTCILGWLYVRSNSHNTNVLCLDSVCNVIRFDCRLQLLCACVWYMSIRCCMRACCVCAWVVCVASSSAYRCSLHTRKPTRTHILAANIDRFSNVHGDADGGGDTQNIICHQPTTPPTCTARRQLYAAAYQYNANSFSGERAEIFASKSHILTVYRMWPSHFW